jgi:hypothetical protein
MGEIKKKMKNLIPMMTKMNFNKHKCCRKLRHQRSVNIWVNHLMIFLLHLKTKNQSFKLNKMIIYQCLNQMMMNYLEINYYLKQKVNKYSNKFKIIQRQISKICMKLWKNWNKWLIIFNKKIILKKVNLSFSKKL